MINRSDLIVKTLYKISNAVNTISELNVLFRRIHQNLGDVLDVTNFSIALYSKEADTLKIAFIASEKNEPLKETKEVGRANTSLSAMVIRKKLPYLLTGKEIKKLSDQGTLVCAGPPVQVWAGVPLMVESSVIGVLTIQSYTDPNILKKEDLELLSSVCEQVALAIDRKRVKEDLANEQLLLKTLLHISNSFFSNSNLEELYESIYKSVKSIVQFEGFAIALYDKKMDSISFPFWEDKRDPDYVKKIENASQTTSVTYQVIKQKRTLLLNEQGQLEIATKLKGEIIGVLAKMWLGIPLFVNKEIFGVLLIQNYTEKRPYTDKELELINSVSTHIANAIERKISEEKILEDKKRIKNLSEQIEQFSLTAASMISAKDDENIFIMIAEAAVKYSDYNRILVSNFKDTPPYHDILCHGGHDMADIERVKKIDRSAQWYLKLFDMGVKIGHFSLYIPYSATRGKLDFSDVVLDNSPPPESEDMWHPHDFLFVRMNDDKGNLSGVISVDKSKSGRKPTDESVRPLEVFSSLISQIMRNRKLHTELKQHRDNLEKMVAERTQELYRINKEMEKRIIERTKELAVAMEKAQTADRLKSSFLATMSHELRTPLNSIIGFTGIMIKELAGPLTPEQHKQLSMVQNSSRHLLALINDVLDISKIEAGQLVLSYTSFDLKLSIKKMVKLVTPQAEKKEIALLLNLPDSPLMVRADQRRIEQVILNLLSNAVKFTEKGHVSVTCLKENDKCILLIADTGIGMQPEQIPHLFQPFHQIDTGLARKYEGTGLGLSICKKILDIMGATIRVDSQLGQGSTFTLCLPK
ncbi:MAG: GAF domain-containing protein [Proteobacteria bacterium]|nr:GAF domain-containing protein [Pseudomonadota bacterium]MBU1581911.1 GAF domain-containing protein [Pseudomonadota bacterium]MBU2631871.1 GAF domain-containing protein [Pseudomonadota bacterium]